MTYEQFVSLCLDIVAIIKENSPYRTGNLRHNAIKFRLISSNKVVIEVNETIAPYMVYTNEPWISPRWNGKTNPNEGWWNRAVERAINETARRLGAVAVLVGA